MDAQVLTARVRGSPPARLVPRWTAWCYLLSPPFIAAIIHPQIFEQDLAGIGYNILAIWIHTVAVGASLHAAFTWVVPRLLREEHGRLRRLSIYAITVIACVVVGLTVSRPLVHVVCVRHEHMTALYDLYTSLLISSGFIAALVSYERLRQHVREIEQREQRAREKALEAELKSLQARTNPHFLFNALNTVAGLIGEDPRRAEAAVERLADLFRYALDASRRERVRLREEIEAVRAYLEMETMRFEHRLRWSIDMDEASERVLVPPLAIQPLVENAVRHGVEGRGSGCVKVEAHKNDVALHVRVSDDGPGLGRSAHVGTRTSLRELRERLRLIYGERAKLEATNGDGGGCTVELVLPAE
ncbi:MAG TPA: histidine kinase [Polyangiaceae bacterium]|nr:histidine kinase [Polyangiaceae bacterium]